jgi:beta-galactosidase
MNNMRLEHSLGRQRASRGPGLLSLLLLTLALPLTAQPYAPPVNPRVEVNLDPGWRFIRQEVSGAQNPGFDDAAWSAVDLPHTWNNLDGEDGGNNYYRGVGWYRSHYTVDAGYAGRRFFLKFDGAFYVTDVWLNGNFLGEHQGGFAAFVFDVTPYLNVGADNVIAVKVSNASNTNLPPLSADFTFFGGLYRDAHLLVTGPVQISPLDYASPGVYLRATHVSSNSANLQVTTVVSNAGPATATVSVRAVVTDSATNIVTTLTNVVTLAPATVSNVVAGTTIGNPHLWNGLADPYLYQVFVEVLNGPTAVDLVDQPLGIRWFNVDPTNGFFLNGQYLDLHGVAMHQDWLDRGWATGDAERLTNFAFLKEIGATALRLSHYQHAERTYQLADQNGLVLWSEIPLINNITEAPAFYTNAQQQLRELIRQQYNHPSVVCWGLFNEITLHAGPTTTNLVSQLAQLAAREDPTRPSVAAANASDSEPSNWYSDLTAFNKYFGWYDGSLSGFGPWADHIHATYPARSIGVSEYGAGANVSQHSEEPVRESAAGGQFHPEEYQNLYHESHWQQMKARPFLWCKLIWNLFDFASDARNEGNLPGRNDKGLVTYDRQVRKDAFYWYKANWTTNPMVYITGHTFTNRLTNAVTAKVYANCDSVEVFLNGNSQGARASTNCIFTWPVTLLRGTNTLLAVGTKGSASVRDSLIWNAPFLPPTASLLNPATSIVYLNSTNDALPLSAAVTDPQPDSAARLTTVWEQSSGPGVITFGSIHAVATTARFNAPGIYGLHFSASKGLTNSVALTVVVEPTVALHAGLVGWWKMDKVDGSAMPDSSGNGRDATFDSGTLTSGCISNSMLFDGLTKSATFALPEANQVTVAAWVRAEAPGDSLFPHVLDTPGYRLFVRFGDPGKNSLGFATYTTPRNGDWFSGPETLRVGAWYHIAASYDRGSTTNVPTFYINGVRLAPRTISSPSSTQPVCAGMASIGNNSHRSRAWKGAICDLRLYNRLLTDPEIQVLASPRLGNEAAALISGKSTASPLLQLLR